jgi:ureidoacrylate peracid hydrolase
MHPVTIPDALIQEVTQRRGRLHPFDRLDAATTALVTIDLQNAFMAPGAPLEVPVARAIVPQVNTLAAAFRTAGAPVVWVRMIAESDPSAWPSRERLLDPRLAGTVNASLRPGHAGYEFWSELDIRAGDLIVDKRRYSAFIQGSSNIGDLLRARGVETIVITGAISNVCCESSARDAMMLGYNVVFVSDASAALTDAAHLSALCSILTVFGDVMTTRETIGCLTGRTSASTSDKNRS